MSWEGRRPVGPRADAPGFVVIADRAFFGPYRINEGYVPAEGGAVVAVSCHGPHGETPIDVVAVDPRATETLLNRLPGIARWRARCDGQVIARIHRVPRGPVDTADARADVVRQARAELALHED